MSINEIGAGNEVEYQLDNSDNPKQCGFLTLHAQHHYMTTLINIPRSFDFFSHDAFIAVSLAWALGVGWRGLRNDRLWSFKHSYCTIPAQHFLSHLGGRRMRIDTGRKSSDGDLVSLGIWQGQLRELSWPARTFDDDDKGDMVVGLPFLLAPL